jgi:hypothetical protein
VRDPPPAHFRTLELAEAAGVCGKPVESHYYQVKDLFQWKYFDYGQLTLKVANRVS